MGERYKKKIDKSPEAIASFEERLRNVSVGHDFSGEKTKNPEGQSETNIEELNAHLKALDHMMRDRDISPVYSENGKFLIADILGEYFKKVLFNQEYAPATIFKVIQDHVNPITERIRDFSSEIYKLEKSNSTNGGAFAKILHSDLEDLDSEIEILKKTRGDMSNSLVLLMKRIVDDPNEFGLVKKEEYKPEEATMSVNDFRERLNNRPYNELFTIDGVTLKIEDQKKICERYLSVVSSLKGPEGKEARTILYRMCIVPSLNRKYDVLNNDDYNKTERNEGFSIIDAEMGEFLNGLEDEKTLLAYAVLIDEGELPDGVNPEDLPIDFPVLYEREPDKLKREMRRIKNPEKMELHRLNHHRERVSRMDADDIERRMQMIRDEGKIQALEIFSTEVGTMPMYRIVALVERFIKESWGDDYEENLFFDFYTDVIVPLNNEYRDLINEEKSLNRKEDGYDQKYRAVTRKQVKLLEGLTEKMNEWINEDDKYTAALEISGAADGQLRLVDMRAK